MHTRLPLTFAFTNKSNKVKQSQTNKQTNKKQNDSRYLTMATFDKITSELAEERLAVRLRGAAPHDFTRYESYAMSKDNPPHRCPTCICHNCTWFTCIAQYYTL